VDELAQTLHENRADRELLDALWGAAERARPLLTRYLQRKAQLLGQERLHWYDLPAPLGPPEEDWSWPRACAELQGALGKLAPELGHFVSRAVEQGWIDALPRERPGAFCASFPRSRQSRVRVTFTGSLDQVSSLAHELGHALHNEILQKQPPSRRLLTRATAETASTLTEALFRQHVKGAHPLALLDQQLQRAVTFLMDMPHRYALERRLYALRLQGPLDPDVLGEESVALQRQWYGDVLASYDPLAWCQRPHLFMPESSFYNWSYTFGYLMSGTLCARAPSWGELEDLLQRTGWQPTSVLGREVLGPHLQAEPFWELLQGWVDAFTGA
jgi:oligoendopeptidase F